MYPDRSELVQYDPTKACVGDEVFWFNNIELKFTIKGEVVEILEGQPLVSWETMRGVKWPYNSRKPEAIAQVWREKAHRVYTRGQNMSMSKAISMAILHGQENQLARALKDDRTT